MEQLGNEIMEKAEEAIDEAAEKAADEENIEIDEMADIADIGEHGESEDEDSVMGAAPAPELAPDYNSAEAEDEGGEEIPDEMENPEILVPQDESASPNPEEPAFAGRKEAESISGGDDDIVLPGGEVIADDAPAAVEGVPSDDEPRNADQAREARQRQQPRRREEISPDARIVDSTGDIMDELVMSSEEDPASAEAETWRLIRRYEREGRILRSRLIGIDRRGSRNTVFMITAFNGIEILIPHQEFFADEFILPAAADPENETESGMLSRIERAASHMLGAEIPFIILGSSREALKPEEQVYGQLPYRYTVMASRRRALNRYKENFLLQVSGPRVQRGSVVKARVLSVSEGTVRVECLGCETSIYAFDLSGKKFVSDCRKAVKPGDTLYAVVSKLYINEETGPDGKVKRVPHLSVSPRLFDLGTTARNLGNMKVNGLYYGIVRSFNKATKVYTVNLDNQVIAAVPEDAVIGGRQLMIGDRVSVRVSRVMESFVRGRAMKI